VIGPSPDTGRLCSNRAMASWVTDVGDLPAEEAAVPAAARERAEFSRAVVEAATARAEEEAFWRSAVRCVGRSCRAERVEVELDLELSEVRWRCPSCGDDGVVRGWSCGEHDLLDCAPLDDVVPWGLDDGERSLLLDATRDLRDLRAVIMRASPHPEHPDVLVVYATVEELDALYTLVEELTDVTRGRRKRELLEELRAGLCVAMDGF
jgi:predicted RNA-binding Zn-ribbon protein involved in translation (DUF1610 family)